MLCSKIVYPPIIYINNEYVKSSVKTVLYQKHPKKGSPLPAG